MKKSLVFLLTLLLIMTLASCEMFGKISQKPGHKHAYVMGDDYVWRCSAGGCSDPVLGTTNGPYIAVRGKVDSIASLASDHARTLLKGTEDGEYSVTNSGKVFAYWGTTDGADVIIKFTGETLNIYGGEKDEIDFVGEVDFINVYEVAQNSLNVHGKVNKEMMIETGHVVIEPGQTVAKIVIPEGATDVKLDIHGTVSEIENNSTDVEVYVSETASVTKIVANKDIVITGDEDVVSSIIPSGQGKILKKFILSFVVNDENYGTVSVANIAEVVQDTPIRVDGNMLTIGDKIVTARETEDTEEYNYEFVSWTGTEATVVDNLTITANFSKEKQKYIIQWKNEDGTVLETDEVLYNETPAFAGNTPTKAPTAQYSFTFKGWDKAISPAKANVSYYAIFNSIANKYTVVWKDSNGTILETDSKVPYGSMPSYNGAVPTKESTDRFSYSFTGWSPVVKQVEGDITYTAQYVSSVNKYTVTWKNENGTIIETDVAVPYGTIPEFNSATPVKDRTSQYSYIFDGWDKEVTAVTGNITYTATYRQSANKYTVIWKNYDNSILLTEEVAYGEMPQGPSSTPVRNATAMNEYAFKGWDKTVSAVESDATYTATYSSSVRKYTVTWKNYNGVALEIDENVSYGTLPVYNGSTPEKQGTDQYSYSFKGWDSDVVAITGDVTFMAQFNEIANKFTVTWKDDDGTVLETDTNVEYGSIPTFDGKEPTKDSDAQYTYSFSGWNVSIAPVISDTVFTAEYDTVVNKYTVTWLNYDDTVLETDKDVPYGTEPSYDGISPAKTSTDQYSYLFTGWDKEIASIIGDTTYKATFSSSINKYDVTISVNNGDFGSASTEIISDIPYGTAIGVFGDKITVGSVVVSAIPQSNTAQYSYSFSEWSGIVSTVTGNTTITAIFERVENSYIITWKDENGHILSTETLKYGLMPSHADLTKENTAEYTYSFNGWNPVIVSVTDNAEYTGSFKATKNKYSVIWKNYDDSVLESDSDVEYGQVPSYDSSSPTRESDKQYSYEFVGWDKEITGIVGDTTYKAKFDNTLNKYTITWKNYDDTMITTEELPYGAIPSYAGITPSRESDAQYSYTFKEWNPDIVPVEEDCTYKALFDSTVNKYVITFKNEDGQVLKTETLAYGEMPDCDDILPLKEETAQYSYYFDEWIPSITSVTGDATYVASFGSNIQSYKVFWKNYDGTLLEGDILTYGSGPVYGGQTPEKPSTAELTYTFVGWTPAVTPISGDVTYTAMFTDSLNSYSVSYNAMGHGTAPSSSVVVNGNLLSEPDALTESGYTFIGWFKEKGCKNAWDFQSDIMPAENITLYALWQPNTNTQYKVEHYKQNLDMLGYSLFDTENLSGTTDVSVSPAVKTYDGFILPSVQTRTIDGDGSLVIKYYYTRKIFTVNVQSNGYGSLSAYKLESIPYGSAVTKSNNSISIGSDVITATPFENTAQYSYSFKEWTGISETITENTIVTATFERDVNKYSIVWLDDDGTEFKTQTLEFGLIPSFGLMPGKEATAEYVYYFAGWVPEITAVSGDATYKATYESSKQHYSVTWKNGESEIVTETYNYGDMPTYTYTLEMPVKSSDVQNDYTFSGWTPALSTVTGNVVYSAKFDSTPRKYTITWKNENGTILKTEQIPYGSTPSYTGLTPTKMSDAQYSYAFKGWDNVPVSVTGDATYTATYDSTVNKYTVTWANDDGSVLKTDILNYGETPSYEGTNPAKASTAQYTYTFESWTPDLTKVSGDVTYKATYNRTVNQYEISWKNYDGSLLKKEQVSYGVIPAYDGLTPEKEEDSQFTYTFKSWNVTPSAVTGTAEYVATFTSVPKVFTIVWKNADGSVLETDSNVSYGATPKYDGSMPTKMSDSDYTYTFKGWNESPVSVTNDATYIAEFHKLKHIEAVSHTCTTDGNIDYWHCDECNKNYSSSECNVVLSSVLDPAAHTENQYGVCSICGDQMNYEGANNTMTFFIVNPPATATHYKMYAKELQSEHVGSTSQKLKAPAVDSDFTAEFTEPFFVHAAYSHSGFFDVEVFAYNDKGEIVGYAIEDDLLGSEVGYPVYWAFVLTDNPEEYVHNFTNIVKKDTLKTEANCTSPAVYYKSCSICGAKGDETFEYGSVRHQVESHGFCELCGESISYEPAEKDYSLSVFVRKNGVKNISSYKLYVDPFYVPYKQMFKVDSNYNKFETTSSENFFFVTDISGYYNIYVVAYDSSGKELARTETLNVAGNAQEPYTLTLNPAYTYEDKWTVDAEAHWHASNEEYDVIADFERHTFIDTVIEPSTFDKEGTVEHECSVCGYSYRSQTSKLSFSSATWKEISSIADAGLSKDYFRVGQKKQVVLNGTVGGINYNNVTIEAVILNIANDGRLTMGLTEDLMGNNISIGNYSYGKSSSTFGIYSEGEDNISGYTGAYWSPDHGWTGSRKTTNVSEITNALPSDLVNVVKKTKKYTANKTNGISCSYGGGFYYESQGTLVLNSADETFWPASEMEIRGSGLTSKYDIRYPYFEDAKKVANRGILQGDGSVNANTSTLTRDTSTRMDSDGSWWANYYTQIKGIKYNGTSTYTAQSTSGGLVWMFTI